GGRRRVPLVWDPHPRGAPPVPGTAVVTPNRQEAAVFTGQRLATALGSVVTQARMLTEQWSAAVAVTLGEGGALLAPRDGAPLAVPAVAAPIGDTCGAGDCFAATVAALLADGAVLSEAVTMAVAAASAFVGAGGA